MSAETPIPKSTVDELAQQVWAKRQALGALDLHPTVSAESLRTIGFFPSRAFTQGILVNMDNQEAIVFSVTDSGSSEWEALGTTTLAWNDPRQVQRLRDALLAELNGG